MIEGMVYIPPLTVIGDDVFISVVTRDVPPETVVYGNPARPRYSLEEYIRRRIEWEEGSRQT